MNQQPFYILFFTVTLFRFFLAGYLGLSDDEAYYWDWSRHLDWSYYDHPGMTTWLIGLSTALFGNSAFAVRLPTLIMSSITWLAIWKFASGVLDQRRAFCIAVLYVLIPILAFGAMMAVPDIPLIFCWTLVLILAWHLQKKENLTLPQWLLVGGLMGLGTLSKYPMALLGFSAFLLLLTTPRLRPQFKKPGLYFALIIWALLCLPILYWNLGHQGASISFQFGDKLFRSSGGFQLGRYLMFWISQLGFLTPPVFVLLSLTLWKSFKERRTPLGRWTLCFSIPTLFVFSTQAGFNEFKPHWPAPGYIALLIASGTFALMFWDRWPRLTKFCLGFLILLNATVYVELLFPFFPRLHSALSSSSWNPLFDPTNEFFGWPEAAEYVRSLRVQHEKETGETLSVATHRYQLTSQMAFALEEEVFNFNPGRDHYDFTQTPERMKPLEGKSFLVFGTEKYEDMLHQDGRYFNKCKELAPFMYLRGGATGRVFNFWICRLKRG